MKKLFGIGLALVVALISGTASCGGDEPLGDFTTLETEPSEGIVGEPWTYMDGGFSYGGYDDLFLEETIDRTQMRPFVWVDIWPEDSWAPRPFGYYNNITLVPESPNTQDWYNPPDVTGTDLVIEDCDRHKHAAGAGHHKYNGKGHDCE